MNNWIVILFLLLTFACNKQEEKASMAKTVLTTKLSGNKIEPLQQKGTIKAGSELFYDLITTFGLDDCILIWRSVFGDQVLNGSYLSKNTIRFYIPTELTQKSGFVNVLIYQKDELVQESALIIEPLEATGIAESFLGPRSLLIDKNQKSMMSVIPLDKYRNPMPDNYQSTFKFKYPKESVRTLKTKVNDFVAYKYFLPQSKTGKIRLAANAGMGNTLEEEILIQPGEALDFEIFVKELYPYADARQHMILKSSRIIDKFGNSIVDGTLINFVITDNHNRKSFYNGVSIGGVVEVHIENPSIATNWNVQAFLFGDVSSNELNLNFVSALKDYEIKLKDRKFYIGPVVGALDQIVPNGTIAILVINGDTVKLEIEEGFTIYEIPGNIIIDEGLDLSVSVLGKTKIF